MGSCISSDLEIHEELAGEVSPTADWTSFEDSDRCDSGDLLGELES